MVYRSNTATGSKRRSPAMRSNRGRGPDVPMAAAAILAALFLANPAAADRHCAPALEQYYGARHTILSLALQPGQPAEDTCEAAAAGALPYLEDAAAAAGNCGCGVLRERIEDVAGQARSTADCPSRIHDVLEAAAELERLAEACH